MTRPSPHEHVRVLLADDHTLMRAGLAQLLTELCGFDVIAQAADGQAAVEEALHQHPDVILMDVSMPRMDGVEATRRIKAADTRVRIVGLSMHDSRQVREEMLSAGAVAYLSKSADPEEVCGAVLAAFRG